MFSIATKAAFKIIGFKILKNKKYNLEINYSISVGVESSEDIGAELKATTIFYLFFL